MTKQTETNARNADWLSNRPMWKIDKTNPELLKHPTRWLAGASYQSGYAHSAWGSGWLDKWDMIAHKQAEQVANSKAKRKAERA